MLPYSVGVGLKDPIALQQSDFCLTGTGGRTMVLRRRQAQPSKLQMASCTVTAASGKARPWKMHQKPAKAAQGQQHCMT